MSILIYNCNIIDGRSNEEKQDCWVVIEGNKISKISAGKPLQMDADTVIDAKGGFLLPGLVNLHVHMQRRHASRGSELFRIISTNVATGPEAQRILFALRNAWYELSRGITTLRDLSSQTRVSNKLRDYFKDGLFNGPRLVTCGTGVCCTGGHGSHRNTGDAIEVDGQYEVMKAVRREIKEGAEFIKMMVSGGLGGMPDREHPDWTEFTIEEIKAGVAAAHSHNKTVTVHAYGEQPPLTALHAGVDGIEHGTRLTDEAIDIMVERGVYYVPTISGLTELCDREANKGSKEMAKLVHEIVILPQRDSVKRAYKRGVLIGAGTDTLGELVQEIELMQECGMTPMDAIKTATSNAACILQMGDRLGLVQEGYLADLLLIDNNPLEDLGNLRNVNTVIRDGNIVTCEWICNLQ